MGTASTTRSICILRAGGRNMRSILISSLLSSFLPTSKAISGVSFHSTKGMGGSASRSMEGKNSKVEG
eukprot:8376654-Ditylum_brightwellii.AAC.1